ncbi:MAG: aldehyde ferredoxin oxidoreductase family protein [candidate division NC10 bacterium]|nr:aldehyde ferredoxin oxidoreductase family protein [candidate division NC10 bacterium]
MGLGYTGKVLEVDFTTGRISHRRIADEVYQKYLGGSGIAGRILLNNAHPAPDPLHPDNPVIFFAGLFTGTLIPGATRLSVCSRSPLTGIWGEATVGGSFGAELKFSGLDGIIIRGQAERPVYLWIQDGRAELRPADDLWGKDTFDTARAIRRETDFCAKVACIGPAGEKLVKISSIIFEGEHGRAAGRTGMGAVLGSKGLKAIAVRGLKGLKIHDAPRLLAWTFEQQNRLLQVFGRFAKYGTTASLEVHEERGGLPVKNFLSGRFQEGAAKTGGRALQEAYPGKQTSCIGCPIHCWQILKVPGHGGWYVSGHNPEYETLGAFGAMCLNEDIKSIVRINELCNRYGLDTISTGNAVAFALEAYEKGLISQGDADGLDLRWGNGHAILGLVERIGRREGLGDLLAEGVRHAAARVGAEGLAMEVKGLELPMHDPRVFWSNGLNYATGNRGACHLEGLTFAIESGIAIPELGYNSKLPPLSTNGKALLTFHMHNLMALYNALGICKFYLRADYGPQRLAEFLHKVTGWDYQWQELMGIGERIFNLKRLYNVKLKVSRKDDVLPQRLLTLNKRPDMPALPVAELEKMRQEYYTIRGWDGEGGPTPGRLAELGITEGEETFYV